MLRVLIMFVGVALHLNAALASSPRVNADTVWAESLDFFELEADTKSLEVLKTRILKERPTDLDNLKHLLEIEIKTKDRSRLIGLFEQILEANGCIDSPLVPDRAVCDRLMSQWRDYLSNFVFFEDTARKMENARRQIESKNCRVALDTLAEVESREGIFANLLQLRSKGFECLGDLESSARTRRMLVEQFWIDPSL